jgi:hypothetical protein
MVTPLPGVPSGGQQALVNVGGLNVHVVPHSTVLFGAQISANGPVWGPLTVKTTVQEAVLPAQSVIVTVIGCVPGPTMVPAAGDCEHVSGPQLSEAHADDSAHKSGIAAVQPVTVSGGVAGELRRQLQSSVGDVVSTTVTVWLHVAVAPQSSTPRHVRVITCGQDPLVVVLTTLTVTFGTVPAAGQQLFV